MGSKISARLQKPGINCGRWGVKTEASQRVCPPNRISAAGAVDGAPRKAVQGRAAIASPASHPRTKLLPNASRSSNLVVFPQACGAEIEIFQRHPVCETDGSTTFGALRQPPAPPRDQPAFARVFLLAAMHRARVRQAPAPGSTCAPRAEVAQIAGP